MPIDSEHGVLGCLNKEDPVPIFGTKKVKDPVCGMEIEPAKAAETSVYQGKAHHFCSAGCKASFDKEPAKYAR